jgi:hypothetical protein
LARLGAEASQGGPLPPTARDYGFLHPGRVNAEAVVAVRGNQYSVPIAHVGAPVTVRVHRARIAIWRDTTLVAEHARAPDGAHQRVVEPAHFAGLFARKPRAQVMLCREALLQLGEVAYQYVQELSRRHRAQLRAQVLGIYALYEQWGPSPLLAAMEVAAAHDAYSVTALRVLLTPPAVGPTDPAGPDRLVAVGQRPWLRALAVPAQAEIDRPLRHYEAYVRMAGDDGNRRPPAVLAEPVSSALVGNGGGQ